ncbi:MAG: hypothetical protein ABEI98_04765 [Halorhabdus sp.]
MTDGDSVAQLAVVLLLLVLAVPTLATAYDRAGTPFKFEEQVTVDYSNPSSVDANATSEGYGTDPTITADGVVLNDTAYDWNASAGSITWYNTSQTTNGQQATIEYRAYQRTQETELAWTVTAPLMGLFGLFGFVAAVRTLWSYIAEVWGL